MQKSNCHAAPSHITTRGRILNQIDSVLNEEVFFGGFFAYILFNQILATH